jgi:hypothetical protein
LFAIQVRKLSFQTNITKKKELIPSFLLYASAEAGIRTSGERVLSEAGRLSEKGSDDKRDYGSV